MGGVLIQPWHSRLGRLALRPRAPQRSSCPVTVVGLVFAVITTGLGSFPGLSARPAAVFSPRLLAPRTGGTALPRRRTAMADWRRLQA